MKLMLFLSHNGILSRRKAFEAIKEGVVTVNGRVDREPSTDIDPARDQVHFHARLVNDKIFEYIMLNKPEGYVTTCERQFGQQTVMELLPKMLQHLRPVGRLDKDTEGLLLFTNDGELANQLAHPSYDVNKTYLVRVRGKITPDEIRRLEEGIVIDERKTAPAVVALIRAGDDLSEFQITIHEGRKHQVRLMADAISRPVVYLSRLSQGPLELGSLPRGEYRRLSEEEAMLLKRIKRAAVPRKKEVKPSLDEKKYIGRRGRGEFNRDQRLLRENQLREKQRLSDERRPASTRSSSVRPPASRDERPRTYVSRDGARPAVPGRRPQDPARRPYVPKERAGADDSRSRDERQRTYVPREGGRSEDPTRRPPRPAYSSRDGHRSSPRSGERPAFSTATDKRANTGTRQWHSESDVHSPKNAPKPYNKSVRRP
ncbi:MAG: pseudouridine synthase [Candidatus Omnitrophica bacterium]|nr:pseudouridine synthase [Candidatus Omnitrophota bacterium]